MNSFSLGFDWPLREAGGSLSPGRRCRQLYYQKRENPEQFLNKHNITFSASFKTLGGRILRDTRQACHPKMSDCSFNSVSPDGGYGTQTQQLIVEEGQCSGGLVQGRANRAAALAAVGAGQAFGRRRQDGDGGRREIGGDGIQGLEGRGGGLRGTRSVQACEVDQRVRGL